MHFALALAIATLGGSTAANAQETAFACRPVFDTLNSEIEANYSAYTIEYARNDARRSAYEAMAADIGAAASQAANRMDCTRTLRRYIDFFSDPHLFLQDIPQYDEARVASLRATAPRTSLSMDAVRAAALASSDPISGIWATDQGDVAIIPVANGYDAVMVSIRGEGWEVGQVRGHLTPTNEGYDVVLYRTADRAPVLHPGRLEGDMRLRLLGLTWGRVEPRPAEMGAAFDPLAPRKPIYVDHSPDVGIIYAPSFDPGKAAEAGAAIVEQYRASIEGKKLLVFDIRGNEGGSQSEWARFASFYATGTWEPDDRQRPENADVILAAPRVISIWELFRDNTGPGPYRDLLVNLVERLKAAPVGTLVPFRTDVAEASGPYTPPELFAGPPAVAIISDSMVVSAGEAFLIDARRSPKVTVFGDNTMGSIDYWTVGIFTIGAGETRYGVGIPIGAASADLPAGGYNVEGVPVDVRLAGPYDTWLPQVLAHYGLK